MRKILVIGAGRSSASLIDYLLRHAKDEDWRVVVADINKEWAEEKIGAHAAGTALAFDIADENERGRLIRGADIVVSMLPARLHIEVARACIANKKPMVTASYITDEMQALDEEAKKAGIVIMNEIGVDPGIDHMSAMRILDRLRSNGDKMLLFESFTGGLLAPESEKGNPWQYKFTWNPRNVVLAGQGTPVKFIQEGKYKYIPYHKLFRRTEIIEIDGYGRYEGYANRDSLKYRRLYHLEDIPTIYRGTLRRPGFCRAWNVFVQLGCTYDSFVIKDSEHMSVRDFINSFLGYNPTDSVELKLRHYLHIEQDDPLWEKLVWMGLFDGDYKPGLKEATPAQMLQHILRRKWQLDPEDRDMIVMWHKFGYERDGVRYGLESSMCLEGESKPFTAMARTVGYPVAIATRMILNGVISTPGVHLPLREEVYEPVLNELEDYGIVFKEKETAYNGYN